MIFEDDEKYAKLKSIWFSIKYWTYLFWEDKYWDIKWAVKNLFLYFKIVTKQRPWGYESILEMQVFQLKRLRKSIENGYTCDESRLPKLQKIDRFIELANHVIADDYTERCGYKHATKIKFVPTPETKDLPKKQRMYTMESEREQTGEELKEIFKNANELANAEWTEMWTIIKGTGIENWNENHDYDYGDGSDARRWWD